MSAHVHPVLPSNRIYRFAARLWLYAFRYAARLWLCAFRYAARLLLLGGLAFTLIGAPALASTALHGKPKLSFRAVGWPGFLTFDGVTRELTYTDDGEHLTFTVPMETVKTGIALRDRHLHENFVEVQKYPEVTLRLKRAEVRWPAEEERRSEGELQAEFTAHGQTHPVPVTYTIQRTRRGLKVDGQFVFDLLKHGIQEPSYMGTTFETEMTATVSLELVNVEE